MVRLSPLQVLNLLYFWLGRGQHRPRPPVCAKQPYTWENCHGEEIHDDYAWLTDKDDPLVMQYLEQENTYVQSSDSVHTRVLWLVVGMRMPV